MNAQKERIADVLSFLNGKNRNHCMSWTAVEEIMRDYCSNPSQLDNENYEDYLDKYTYKSNMQYLLCGLWLAFVNKCNELYDYKKSVECNEEKMKYLRKVNNRLKEEIKTYKEIMREDE